VTEKNIGKINGQKLEQSAEGRMKTTLKKRGKIEGRREIAMKFSNNATEK